MEPLNSFYAFHCAGCHRQVRKVADHFTMCRLRSSGVTVHQQQLPAELAELKAGAPISPHDVVEFTLALRGRSFLSDIARLAITDAAILEPHASGWRRYLPRIMVRR
jgi:hypothetical protein